LDDGDGARPAADWGVAHSVCNSCLKLGADYVFYVCSMSSHPIPTELETPADPYAERRQRNLLIVDTLLDISIDLTQLVQTQAHAEVETASRLCEPAPDFTVPFDRMSRSVRQSVMLSDRLMQPVKAARPAADRVAVRKRIIRVVEDSIEGDAPVEAGERLRGEFQERLDSRELEEEIGDRPVEDIIADIRRDLGLAERAGGKRWKRRTPGDVVLLCARAATKLPAVGPFVLPMPPRGWVYDDPLFRPHAAGRVEGSSGIRGP
jgi:hypothetical protein